MEQSVNRYEVIGLTGLGYAFISSYNATSLEDADRMCKEEGFTNYRITLIEENIGRDRGMGMLFSGKVKYDPETFWIPKEGTYQSLHKARKKAKRWKRKYLKLKYKLDHPTSSERELGYNPYQE